MSELGDTFRDLKEARQEKRASNREQSAQMLADKGVVFEEKNFGAHLIVEGNEGYIDFWPGTGRWICRTTQKRGFGVRNLLKYIGD